MKTVWIVVTIALLITASWVVKEFVMTSPVAEPPVTLDSREQPQTPPNTVLADKLKLAEAFQSAEVEDGDRPELQRQMTARRNEIQQQIALLNDSLYDPEQRDEIQKRLKDLIAQYNEVALPLALEQMTQVQ